ncbi:MAG: type II secretion system protein [bacterium]
MKKEHNGFTLIELLIVVAIIAILAAIAIPNFLAAQTRAKVSRLKGEFNTLGTAIEAYNVDANSYPIYNSSPNIQNGVFGDDAYGSNRFDVLTTPVAYITSMPKDPFSFVGMGGASAAAGIGYFLYCWQQDYDFVTLTGGGPFRTIWHASYWALKSRGPDGRWNGSIDGHSCLPWYNNPPWCINGDVFPTAYDPSNGTVSYGDIIRTSRHGQY